MVTGRFVVACVVVELFVVVVTNAASVRYSRDAVTSLRRQQLKPCGNDVFRTCHRQATRQFDGDSRRRRSLTSDEKTRSDAKDDDMMKHRSKQKSPSPPPPQKVSLKDKSVAAALALAPNIGRGGQPRLPSGRPLTGARPRPQALGPVTQVPGSHVIKQPATAKTKVSKGSKDSKNASGGGGADVVNVMLALGCEAEPCQHGGVCYTDAFSSRGFSCRCPTGYFGDICEYDTELCVSGPCLNDAKCLRDPSDTAAYKCECAPGFYGLNCEHELTREALELMSGGSAMSHYYDFRLNPVLLQLAVAAVSLFLLIIFITFFCCIEIRRDSIVEKRKLLRAIGLDMEFPKISLLGIAFKLMLNCLQCRCFVSAKKDKDPRASIPLIMPSTVPPVPRAQNNNAALSVRPSQLSHVSAAQWQHLQQLDAQRAVSLQQQQQLHQLQAQQLPATLTSGHVTRQPITALQSTSAAQPIVGPTSPYSR